MAVLVSPGRRLHDRDLLAAILALQRRPAGFSRLLGVTLRNHPLSRASVAADPRRPSQIFPVLQGGRRTPGSLANGDADRPLPRVESGRNQDRPELGKALHLAKVTGATLVIAKLDRLSRNAAFLLTLRDSGVRFATVDLPGERPDGRDHGTGGAAGARDDLPAHEGGAGGGQKPRRAARESGRGGRAPTGGKGGAPPARRTAERRATCPRLGVGRRGHPRCRPHQPRRHRQRAQRPRHAHPARRTLDNSTVVNLLDRLGLRAARISV